MRIANKESSWREVEVEVGDLVLEETENPFGDGGRTIVADEAIPFIQFFACSITFNILVGAGA